MYIKITIEKCKTDYGENNLTGKATISEDPTGFCTYWEWDIKSEEDFTYVFIKFEELLSSTTPVLEDELFDDDCLKSKENISSLKQVKKIIAIMDIAGYINNMSLWRNPPLHWLMRNSHFNLFYLLHFLGASIAAKNSEGLFPVHRDNNEYEIKSILCFLIENNAKLDLVKKFIRYGANINARGYSNKTALHIAVEKKDEEMAEMLIAHGAVVNKKDINYKSPLVISVEQNHLYLFKLLIANGARIDEKLEGKKALLHLSIELGSIEIVRLLVSMGANLAPGKTACLSPVNS